jgi:amidase
MSTDPNDRHQAAIDRREFVRTGVVAGTLVMAGGIDRRAVHAAQAIESAARQRAIADEFDLAEITIDQLQESMRSGARTSRSITEAYLGRIAAMDQQGPAVNAIIELNPDAAAIADGLDAERKSKGPRGPMHGVPVLIKDNIATQDKMQSTAGSLALVDATVPRDAFLVQRLRAAGAVILGKTNLSEWANYRSTHSSSGWSGRGGQTRNPYALDRTPSGSSAGTGVSIAANFATVGVGTETDGSIVSPSSCNSLVGLKPTIGLLSRSGIVPISHVQDTPGPMCRTVRDAAILLGAMTGVDTRDGATAEGKGHTAADYTTFLDPRGLSGARIGIARAKFFGYHAGLDHVVDAAIDVMRHLGATIVDPADIETTGKYDDAESEALLYEFKANLNRYLSELGGSARVHTLADVIAFNQAHRDAELPFFGQELMIKAQAKGPLTSPAYLKARAKCTELSRTQGIDHTMNAHRLDAIVIPTGNPPTPIDLVNGDGSIGDAASSSTPAAVAGYPSITVPVGYIWGLPVGMSFIGRAYSEGPLLKFAYAYEQAAKMRQQPTFKVTPDLGHTGRPTT